MASAAWQKVFDRLFEAALVFAVTHPTLTPVRSSRLRDSAVTTRSKLVLGQCVSAIYRKLAGKLYLKFPNKIKIIGKMIPFKAANIKLRFDSRTKVQLLSLTFKSSKSIEPISSAKNRLAIGAPLSAGCDDFMRPFFREVDIFDAMHKHIGVRYICEDSNPANLPAIKYRDRGEMTATDFRTLPESLVADLRQGILEADRDLIGSSIEQVRLKNAVLGEEIANCILLTV